MSEHAEAGDIGAGAVSGATAGAAFGPWGAAIGAVVGAGGVLLQGQATKKAAGKAGELSPAQLEILSRSQEASRLLFGEFSRELTGTFGARERRRAREDAEFFADFAKRGRREALQSNLSFLAGTGLLRSGRAAQIQARGAAEIERVGELTARQVFEQRRQTAFNRKLAAAGILQQFIAPGTAIANRPQFIATDQTGTALAGLGGGITGLFSQFFSQGGGRGGGQQQQQQFDMSRGFGNIGTGQPSGPPDRSTARFGFKQ